MSDAVTAQPIKRSDCAAVIEYLARDPLSNLLLLEQASRLGQAPAAGEMRSEAAVAVSYTHLTLPTKRRV